MSTLHKDFDHAQARIGTYLKGQYTHQDNVGVEHFRYKEKIEFSTEEKFAGHQKHFNIKVRKDVGRFDIYKVINEEDHATYFNEVPKIGDKFGGSYTT